MSFNRENRENFFDDNDLMDIDIDCNDGPPNIKKAHKEAKSSAQRDRDNVENREEVDLDGDTIMQDKHPVVRQLFQTH